MNITVNTDFAPLPFPAAPPHAPFAPLLAHLDCGSNIHGSLSQYFYACTDNDFDQARLVLWSGSTGSQEDDDIGRLTPCAWIDFAEQDADTQPESWSQPSILSELLATALANWIALDWVTRDAHLASSDILSRAELDSCWNHALEQARTLS